MLRPATATIVTIATAIFAIAGPLESREQLRNILTIFFLDDFETYRLRRGEAHNLLVPGTLSVSTIARGQGPNLVGAGATYVNPETNDLYWNGDEWYGIESQSFEVGWPTLEIHYTKPVDAFGIDLKAFEWFGYSGTLTVFNNEQILGKVGFTLRGTRRESVFVGWHEPTGITKVELFSPDYPWSPVIDNHEYSLVPEASTGVLVAFLLLPRLKRR
jgi:hypothetical protein